MLNKSFILGGKYKSECLIKYVGPKCTSFKILDQVGVPTCYIKTSQQICQSFQKDINMKQEGIGSLIKKVKSDEQSLEQ